MDQNGLNLALISTTIERGLKDMKKDLNRTLRNLTDIGLHFSKSKEQKNIFSIFQSYLKQDNSPYYSMIENLLNNSTEKDLLTLGINLACNSWIYKDSEGQKRKFWILFPESLPSDIFALDDFITEQKNKGIYSFVISENIPLSKIFFDLINKHSDCIFFYLKDKILIDENIFTSIKSSSNLLILFNASNKENLILAEKFRENKKIYSIYNIYGTFQKDYTNVLLSFAETYNSPICVSLSSTCCEKSTQLQVNEIIKNYRVAPTKPVLLLDARIDSSNLCSLLKN